MFRSGLLVLCADSTSEQRLRVLLTAACKLVHSTLYVHVLPSGVTACKQFIDVAQTRRLAARTYNFSSLQCSNTDVRFLLPCAQSVNSCDIRTLSNPCQLVLTARDTTETLHYVRTHFHTEPDVDVRLISDATLDSVSTVNATNDNQHDDSRTFDHVALGGTFDRLHAGHKVLLTEACLRTDVSLTVGVTDGAMISKKQLCEMILPLASRMAAVSSFLSDIKPGLHYNVIPITDPYGPAITDHLLQCLVVSDETRRGGERVNEKRLENGLNSVDMVCIELLEDACHSSDEEDKISSSSTRKRLLGTLLKPPSGNLENYYPYIIGLTGGIASGKTSVSQRLQGLGATVVNCDKLGHRAYEKGSYTFQLVVDAFGPEVVDAEDGGINRKELAKRVFADKSQLEKLNAIVWPAIAQLVTDEIRHIREQDGGCGAVVVLDAAVLIEAGWHHMVHEVWTTFVPVAEAVKRIVDRNQLSEDEALRRIESQLSNEKRIQMANVVLSTLWEYDVTQRQVEKAWSMLQERISSVQGR